MEDFFNEQKLRKEVLNWCDKNLFLDAYDYVPKNKHKFFEVKQKIDIFLSLSITTWMLIINDKIKEHKILQLNIDKTRKVLKWKPVLNLEETIRETVFWYKSVVYEKKDAVKITSEQISSFFNKI